MKTKAEAAIIGVAVYSTLGQVRLRVLLKAAPVPDHLGAKEVGGRPLPEKVAGGGEVEGHALFRSNVRRAEQICRTQNSFAAAGKNSLHGEYICGGRKKSAADGIYSRREEKICATRNNFSTVGKNLQVEE